MHVKFRNVNGAFRYLVKAFKEGDLPLKSQTSRAGNVLFCTEPVTITYIRPQECVLFNAARDANPFFHLMESIWMLAGRNDVAPLEYFNSKIAEVASDDGKIFNGAYGYRWRRDLYYDKPLGTARDQLQIIVDQLKLKPDSRRSVLQIWNVEDDLLKIDKTKDVPCNTQAYFMINDDKLDMTVCNRSNDLIWGALGANVVHFSFLQQYLATHIGVQVGCYNQFTNNLHVYLDRWNPQSLLDDSTPDYYSGGIEHFPGIPLIHNKSVFDQECAAFVNEKEDGCYSEPFLSQVASPMCLAFRHHKERDYVRALEAVNMVQSRDWSIAGEEWLRRRYENWSAKQAQVETNPYLFRELKRQASGYDIA